LLLPAFFALAVPASLAVERRSLPAIATASTAVAWSLVAVVALRPPPPPRSYVVADVADWRTVEGSAIVPKDVTFGLSGMQVGEAYRAGVRGYLTDVSKSALPGRDPHRLVVDMGSIGVPAWHTGTNVWVVDIGGLAEPLAARFPDVPGRPAGHRKATQTAWYDARFGAAVGGPKVVAARHALTCQPISGLLRAVDAPLTPSRFFSNILHSFSYTTLHIPDDPIKAQQRFCKSTG
jgi:arabinofuranosyltransferase